MAKGMPTGSEPSGEDHLITGLYHIGLWHSLSVIVSAVLGRSFVPRLIRW